jgi:hypothetical protein
MRKKKKWLAIMAIILVVLICGVIWIDHQLEIDTCMDNGGRWDGEKNMCSFVNK